MGQMELDKERLGASRAGAHEESMQYRREIANLKSMLEVQQRERDKASEAVLVRGRGSPVDARV